MDDDIGEVGWSGEACGQVGLAVANDDGNNDDDERRDGKDGEVSLLQMEVEFDNGDRGVGDRAQRRLKAVANRTQPLHKATPTGLSRLYNQIACLLSEADVQGPMVAMQPQVAEVYKNTNRLE